MQSVQKHDFGKIPQANIRRSVFNLSHNHKTTFASGYLIPILAMEVYPGDTFNLKASMLARLASPLKYPIMDNVRLDCHFFFVPHRLVWADFQHFMGEKDNPNDSTVYTVPYVTTPAGGVLVETLLDYIGVMIQVAGKNVNALYTRSYNRIYNDWYKDQNLINNAVVDTDAGPDTYTDYVLRKRAKYHDYFTSCLPWPQKGTAVELPLGTEAPVLGIGKINTTFPDSGGTAYESNLAGRAYAHSANIDDASANTQFRVEQSLIDGAYPYIRADLENATAATINSLREAFQLQIFYETLARGGSRYVEILRSCFGVISPDARLQRSEFLGGSSGSLVTHTIPNTSATATEKQGQLAAYGEIRLNGVGFTKSFVEHGLVFGIVSTRADLTYQQGLHKKFSRSTRYDFMWPQFCHLGEQIVLKQELYCDASSTDDDVFGYQERYAELRMEPSRISGKFRSVYATPLDSWHLSQEFGSCPTLSQTFIEETPPMDRIKAVTTEPDWIFDSYFDIKAARALPTYGVPGRIDHF